MVGSIDATFIATYNQKVIAFKLLVAWYGRGMATEINAIESSRFWVLEFASSPYDMFGS